MNTGLAPMRVLVMTAVDAERDAVLRGLRGDGRFDVRVAGVGPVAAAVSTAAILATAGCRYGLVISAGIGGGFNGRAEVGSLVVADEMIALDLGVETREGFSSLEELGFGSTRIRADGVMAARVIEAMRTTGLSVHAGPVLTVSTATGTAATAAERAARVPGAAAEGMEGYGVAAAARHHALPVLEIRSISNPVGPRDRASWKIAEALAALSAASSVLVEAVK